MYLEPGDQIGEFNILEVIGEGGFSIVYKAEDTSLQRTVALKQLNPGVYHEFATADKFRREARLAASLNHPHIVQTYALREENETLFLVMEYMAGGSVRDLISQHGYISQSAVIKMASNVCHALTTLHSRGIIHRDIKPENILSNAEGIFKLADFGLAHDLRVEHGDRGVGPQSGTLLYMSTEQAMGEKVTARSDIYSLATVLYEALTGRYYLPESSDDEGILTQILTGEPIPPSFYNPLLEAFDEPIMRALQKSPEHRQPNARTLYEELRNAARQRRSQPLPPELAEELKTIRLLRDVLNEPEQAIARLNFPNLRDADYPEVIAERGEMLLSLGDLEAGVELLRQAVAIQPELPYAQLALARQYEVWGNENAYTGAMVAAINADPDLVFAEEFPKMQDELVNSPDRFWRRVALFQRAAATGGAGVHFNLGRAIMLAPGYEREAVICFENALDRAPTMGAAYTALGSVFMSLGEFSRAASILRRATLMDFPQIAEDDYAKAATLYRRNHAWRGLVLALLRLNENIEAVDAALEFMHADPDEFSKESEEFLSRFIDVAVGLLNAANYAEAVRFLDKVVILGDLLDDNRATALLSHARQHFVSTRQPL
jgi:tRNA A-37 threonylcarbamoyl transferase component Bud32/tetratricopeptide (TPR) repeat protein